MTPDQRAAARNRVKELTGWIAGAAAALTLGFALGAGHHTPATTATAASPTPTTTDDTTQPEQAIPEPSYDDNLQAPSSAPVPSYSPPAATTSAS